MHPSLIRLLIPLLLIGSVNSVSASEMAPHVVIVVAEREYETESSLRRFAEERLQDYQVSFVTADPSDRNRLLGLDAIESADVLLVSVRRRTLPTAQLQQIRDYVAAGKPVLGIRTANHAFSVRGGDVQQGRAVWPKWDQQVFGGNYSGHYGNSLDVTVDVNAGAGAKSPLLEGLQDVGTFPAGGSLYQVRPLATGAQPLMVGKVNGKDPEPVAWTYRRDDGGKSFYTSLGHKDDFSGNVLPTVLSNAISWALESESLSGNE